MIIIYKMDHLQIINDCNDIDKMKIKLELLNSKEEESVMYILVNSDIKMEKGKTANQCCHSACRVTRLIESHNIPNNSAYNKWVNNFEPKIVLKCSEQEMNKYIENYGINKSEDIENMGIWCTYTRDIGRTQIETGSLTTIAFCPIFRKNTPDMIKKLKLL